MTKKLGLENILSTNDHVKDDQTKPPRTWDGGERLQMDSANAACADDTNLEGGGIALEQEGGGEGGGAAAGGGGQGGSHGKWLPYWGGSVGEGVEERKGGREEGMRRCGVRTVGFDSARSFYYYCCSWWWWCCCYLLWFL